MKINICLPVDGSGIWFKKDLTHPVCVANSWERIICDSCALYEKELASLVCLNLLCFSIRHFRDLRSFPDYERLHISSVLKLCCRYVRNFVYVERSE